MLDDLYLNEFGSVRFTVIFVASLGPLFIRLIMNSTVFPLLNSVALGYGEIPKSTSALFTVCVALLFAGL